MLFRQLFEPDSSTYTYLLACSDTRQCVLIDPVIDTVERDLEVVRALGLTLAWTLETHIHADHITGAKKLRHYTGCRIAAPAMDRLECVDVGVEEGTPFRVGGIELRPLYTPGHTDTHHAYLLDNGMQLCAFVGDALLIEACGRTDFQSGDAGALYDAVTGKLFTLADETLVYPAHDYEQRRITTIGQEKARNPRLGNGRTREEFIALMNGLDLPYPRKIDFAVPGNQACGACPDNVPEQWRGPCEVKDLPPALRRPAKAGDQG